eukprot:5420289-Prymnesium_polylepis.1
MRGIYHLKRFSSSSRCQNTRFEQLTESRYDASTRVRGGARAAECGPRHAHGRILARASIRCQGRLRLVYSLLGVPS